MAYETFAFIYDEVMDDTLYQKWLAFTERHLPKETTEVLELACGTGALAVELAKANYQVTALDLSEEMLMMASQRSAEEEVEIQFVQGDMLDLSEIGQYQAITCYSDSLCYMSSRQEVQQVFDEAYQALTEDGVFIFDVHSIYQMTKVFPDYSYHYQTEEFAFLWDSYPGEKEYSIEHFLTFFVQDDHNEEQFLRKDELHQERTYTLENYLMMLENTGFSDFKVYADFTDEAPRETSTRWFFVCKK
ncbi:ubiquinone/menaquinone biosynthesis C-methylase UbiE [Enterococcus sp. PF1-24]|uniref:class I SAM-dependent DNA methyltransferase n=1 Tax=unclassified Enterococcus TaxID=2608891 RepID=UPI002476BEA9|nr:MULTISPECIES: class I SAM-dependent methyltransferase [unclassified Enterococcus]MDH6365233.1 ubiquinone/menaquinone biosynthesis C-methylase UbiE [Enterococcus sp. PFB1-1]MDH6402334.1 ubiquinone/menaquinone biosynthesis C-methylase UbiE [Enterococcus sp. PF1-24]